MPIYIDLITRRKFLEKTIGAAATLLFAGPIAAISKKTDPNCFVLLSDPHIEANPGRIARGVNMKNNLEAAIAQITALQTTPAGAIICGDLAFNIGTANDYKQLAEVLDKLTAKLPTHLMMGNHDNLENLYSVLTESKPQKPILVGKHISIVKTPFANWFLLDSLEKTNSTPGFIGKEQLIWLARELDRNKSRPAIVMAHHNTHPPNKKPENFGGLKDSDDLMDVIISRKHVKAYFHGHNHSYTQHNYSGLHIISLPTTGYVFDKSQPSAWILAKLSRSGIGMELFCMDSKHPLNRKKTNLTWR